MCPVCYLPLLVAILSALGLTSAHIWIDDNPFISGVSVGVGSIALTWGIYKLYKYFTRPKVCTPAAWGDSSTTSSFEE
jgi:hypothetical protein